jgi:hypothetical protein
MEQRLTTLELMWKMSYTVGIQTRQKEGQDGKENWDLIKESIQVNISFVKGKIEEVEKQVEFIKLTNEITEEIMKYEHKDEEGNVINEKNHFMIQTIRIPNQVEFSIVRLIQIAYNIGQYEGIGENIENLPRKALNEFITNENIELINSAFL